MATQHKEYRQNKIENFNRVAGIVTENFEAFCIVAQELKEPTRIDTPYGAFTFVPSLIVNEENLK